MPRDRESDYIDPPFTIPPDYNNSCNGQEEWHVQISCAIMRPCGSVSKWVKQFIGTDNDDPDELDDESPLECFGPSLPGPIGNQHINYPRYCGKVGGQMIAKACGILPADTAHNGECPKCVEGCKTTVTIHLLNAFISVISIIGTA